MHRTRVACIVASLFAAAVLVPPSPAQAQESPFTGRWHLNKALSKLSSGEIAPADLVIDILRADNLHMRWSVTIADDKGQTDVETFDTPANGDFYFIDADTSVSFRLTGSSLQATFRNPNGPTDTMGCTLSSDQRQMTCNGTLTQQDGKVSRYVDVFDRTAR